MMKLALFKTLWGHDGTLTEAIRLCHESSFQGIEASAPHDPSERAAFFEALQSADLEWIAEISTCTRAFNDSSASGLKVLKKGAISVG